MYHHIFAALSSQNIISVYVKDKEYLEVFQFSNKISVSNRLEESDIVLITDKHMLAEVLKYDSIYETKKKRPVLFTTNYRFLEKSKEIIGAFYWKKGRSQILFIKNRLHKLGLHLPQEYEQFMVDEL